MATYSLYNIAVESRGAGDAASPMIHAKTKIILFLSEKT
jgi:hypothetical protein